MTINDDNPPPPHTHIFILFTAVIESFAKSKIHPTFKPEIYSSSSFTIIVHLYDGRKNLVEFKSVL